jgi:hypothetical protein
MTLRVEAIFANTGLHASDKSWSTLPRARSVDVFGVQYRHLASNIESCIIAGNSQGIVSGYRRFSLR